MIINLKENLNKELDKKTIQQINSEIRNTEKKFDKALEILNNGKYVSGSGAEGTLKFKSGKRTS
jgi:hypothetical protein